MSSIKKYRWMIYGILCFAYIIGFMHRLALGTVKDNLIGAFHLSATAFANLSSAYFYAYIIMQIPAGILVDMLGAKKIVVGGSIVAGVGSVVFGLASSVQVAFISRLLVGLGASVIYIAILKILTEWFFRREFATLSGVTSFVGNMGGVLSTTPLFFLVALLTWRYTFIAIGLLGIVAGLLVTVFVKDRPSEMGLPAINDIEDESAVVQEEKVGKALMSICKNPSTWPPFFFFGAFYGAFQALAGTWGQSYLVKVYGLSGDAAANLIIFAVVGIAVGSVAVGKLSDWLGRRKLPMLMVGGANLFFWGFLLFVNGGKPPAAWLPAILFMIGFTSAAYMTCWAIGKEVNSPRYVGISVAFINAGGALGAAFVPVLVGWVMDRYGSGLSIQALYQRAFLACWISVLVGLIAGTLVKETKCGNPDHLDK
jgi:sugar phosphate permease